MDPAGGCVPDLRYRRFLEFRLFSPTFAAVHNNVPTVLLVFSYGAVVEWSFLGGR